MALAGLLTIAEEILPSFLMGEAIFMYGVKDDVTKIVKELKDMKLFLEENQTIQAGTSDVVASWLEREMRNIAQETEDVIESYDWQVGGQNPSPMKLVNQSIQKLFCMDDETNIYNTGKRIKEIKEKLENLKSWIMCHYGGINNIGRVHASNNRQVRGQQRANAHADGDNLVGFENDILQLKEKLVSGESELSVVSILGRGGSGKTSLAKKLYNDHKSLFELHAWVNAPREREEPRDFLARVRKSLIELTDDVLISLAQRNNEEDMKRYLLEILSKKRYLIVIDNMWNEELWECLINALTDADDGNSSRIINTTRIESVAQIQCERTYVHNLRGLPDEDKSWELFSKIFLSNQSGTCPPEDSMMNIARKMVTTLDGLPLAITVLGVLLSKKPSNEWRDIQESIWKALDGASIRISTLLDWSFNNIERELQSCFLYLGFFPEGYAIDTGRLVQLWIAEDLIGKYGVTLENMAKSYLEKLNARGLIQLITNEENTSSLSCRVDLLLRDLAVNKAKNQDFFHIYDETLNPVIAPMPTRRIAFRSGFENYASGTLPIHLHTLSFLQYDGSFDDDDVTMLVTLMYTEFRWLRVLDLEGVTIATTESKNKLYKAIEENLRHLRYFGLYETDNDELPPNLIEGMQILDGVSGSRIQITRCTN